jgi:hypothetical protein
MWAERKKGVRKIERRKIKKKKRERKILKREKKIEEKGNLTLSLSTKEEKSKNNSPTKP